MSFRKAIESGKERRRPRKGGCRRHDGRRTGCQACELNRQAQKRREKLALKADTRQKENDNA